MPSFTPLNVLFTVNSSLLVWNEHTKLLIDGLHGSALQFSPMSPLARHGLAEGLPPFNDVDYLLFTHGHPDHFSLPEVTGFLARHSVSGLALPPRSGQDPGVDAAVARALPASARFLQPDVPPWSECTYTLGDFTVTYLHTPHITAPFNPECHYSILLRANGITLFIGGDAAFPNAGQLELLCRKGIDYGFFIPFYLFHRDGRQTLSALHPKMTYIYHTPYERPENRDFLSLVEGSMRTHAVRLSPITLLRPDAPQFALSRPN